MFPEKNLEKGAMQSLAISIVTPTFNSERFLEATILSVLKQSASKVEYIIIDGGSTDGTLEIIRKYEKHLAFWVSEPDGGMYDAVNKGFAHTTGDILCWINSDDTLLPGALEVVRNTFARHQDLNWIHGRTLYTDENDRQVQQGPLYLFHQRDIRNGYHGLCTHYVQQHCCFWRAALWRSAGPIRLNLKYAGDYWLWTQFARDASLISIDFPVATFRRHRNQLHKQGKNYRREVLECYNGSIMPTLFRRCLRQIARRSDIDIRLINWSRSMPLYRWIDPLENNYIR